MGNRDLNPEIISEIAALWDRISAMANGVASFLLHLAG